MVISRVLDRAAKMTIRKGPKIGWKLSATVNERYL